MFLLGKKANQGRIRQDRGQGISAEKEGQSRRIRQDRGQGISAEQEGQPSLSRGRQRKCTETSRYTPAASLLTE